MALEILQKMVSYPTITPHECGIYDYIKTLLPDFTYIESNKEHIKNIFLYKIPDGYEIQDAWQNLEHICFAGHIDVVPAGGGENNKDWIYPPFQPTIHDGYIYGRGTQDMKGGIASFIKAIQNFLSKYKANMIISVLLTSDEEGEALYGTKHMLHTLKSKGMLPKRAIVAEPTCDKIIGDTIKIGRRGSINGTILIEGKQGHVAYPSKCINPIELLGDRLGKIAGINLDNGDNNFEPSKLVISNIHAGLGVNNVVPKDLIITFNVRNGILSNMQNIKSYIDSVLEGLPYKLDLQESAKSFITEDKNFREILANSIKAYNGIDSEFSTSGGTSDARFFAEHNISVIELGVCNDRIHALNERVSLQDIHGLSQIFEIFLHNINELAK